MTNKWLLSVPTLFGLESLAAREIRMLGYDTEQVEDGRVSFYGDARAICRANIWLRTAERVQIKIGDFTAVSFSELFDQTKALHWADILPRDANFPVSGHCLSSRLRSVPDCQSIIKKAIVESMKSRWDIVKFNETGPLYRINFNIIRDRVTIYIDTSGDGLHKRGYRENTAPTPIRETLAAALVDLSRWHPGKALWDPFCGSGTIAIEAAMIAAHRAPGLTRGFVAESWKTPCIPPHESVSASATATATASAPATASASATVQSPTFKSIFNDERAKARALYDKKLYEPVANTDTPAASRAASAASRDTPAAGHAASAAGYAASAINHVFIEIAGSDYSRQCVRAARQNAKEAGVAHLVRFFQMNAKQMDLKQSMLSEVGIKFPARGCIVTNPPYGERHNDKTEALETCREWAPALVGFHDWSWCIISALDDFERAIGRRASKRRKLNNGKIKCQTYLFWQ